MSISAAIGAATKSLAAYGASLAVIQENIANATTPGFARRRPEIGSALVLNSNVSSGAELTTISTLRSQLLDFQFFSATQASANLQTTASIFDRVELGFPLNGSGSLGDSLDQFFGAASEAAVNPGDLTLRSHLKSAASSLASSFHTQYQAQSEELTQLDTEAHESVRRINELLSQVADLQKIRAQDDASTAETRTFQILDELSGLIDFSVLVQRPDEALALTAGGNVVLSVGDVVRPLSVTNTSEGLRVFDSAGNDVTDSLQGRGGQLGALLEARNETIPALQADINRLAKNVFDAVNEQLTRGADLNGSPGQALFDYQTSFFDGAGRTAGSTGTATPVPQPSITVDFTGGVTASITASLDSFFVAAAPPAGIAAGDQVSVSFTSADGKISTAITTAPLSGTETTAELATRLNDQISLDADLAGNVSFSDEGGSLKVVLSDQAGQGFSFTSTTNNPAFTSGLESGATLGGQSAQEIAGLESGATLGGQSAQEIAAALNAQVALDAGLVDAGVRFTAISGELRLDGDIEFDFTVTDADPAATGFSSGLDGVSDTSSGANAALTVSIADISANEIALGDPPDGSGNSSGVALANIANRALLGGLTGTQFYAGIVADVGIAAQTVRSNLDTQTRVTQSASAVRESFSGVDLNEEGVELLRFEQGYRALLQVIQVLDGLATDVLNIVRQ